MSYKLPPLDADDLHAYDAPIPGKPLRCDPLTVEEILAWTDAYKAHCGQWPKMPHAFNSAAITFNIWTLATIVHRRRGRPARSRNPGAWESGRPT